jgi:hypothetical protein
MLPKSSHVAYLHKLSSVPLSMWWSSQSSEKWHVAVCRCLSKTWFVVIYCNILNGNQLVQFWDVLKLRALLNIDLIFFAEKNRPWRSNLLLCSFIFVKQSSWNNFYPPSPKWSSVMWQPFILLVKYIFQFFYVFKFYFQHWLFFYLSFNIEHTIIYHFLLFGNLFQIKTRPVLTGFKIAVRHKLLTHYKKAKVLYD